MKTLKKPVIFRPYFLLFFVKGFHYINMDLMVAQWLMFWPYENVQEKKCLPGTLLAVTTSSVNGDIFCDMTLSVCLWGFDRQYLKNNANKGRR